MSDETHHRPTSLKTFMVWIHVISISVYPLTRSKFWLSFYSDIPIMYYWVIFIFGISFSCYRHCICDPGFVTPEDDPEHPEHRETPEHPETPEDKKEEEAKSKYFYCTHCKQYIPLRARHCKRCNRCVIRRDHHCPFTGQCIGRDNHLIFLIWCYIESFLMGTVALDTFFSLFNFKSFSKYFQLFYYSNISSYSSVSSVLLHYLDLFKANFFLVPFMFFDAFQVFSLAFVHTMMAINNLTTWELLKKGTISYFDGYPVTKNPFNKGIKKNFQEFLIMKKEKLTWNEPPPPNLDDFVDEYSVFGEKIMSYVINMFL